VYGGAKAGGKSWLGASLTFGEAFIYPGCHYFIARDSLSDLRKYTLPTIYKVFKDWGVTQRYYNFNGQDNIFKLHNDSKIYLIDAAFQPRDPLYQRFGSIEMTKGWIEEAGQFRREAKNALAATIGRHLNQKYSLPATLLQTCNPSKNYLYKDYYKPWKEGTLKTWEKFIQAFPQDNKMLDDGYSGICNATLKQKGLSMGFIWSLKEKEHELSERHRDIVNFNLGTYNLEQGKFLEGLGGFLLNVKKLEIWFSPKELPYKFWQGGIYPGRTLILFMEGGGIGDEFITVRWMDNLKALGFNPIYYTTRKELFDIFNRCGYKTVMDLNNVPKDSMWTYAMQTPLWPINPLAPVINIFIFKISFYFFKR